MNLRRPAPKNRSMHRRIVLSVKLHEFRHSEDRIGGTTFFFSNVSLGNLLSFLIYNNDNKYCIYERAHPKTPPSPSFAIILHLTLLNLRSSQTLKRILRRVNLSDTHLGLDTTMPFSLSCSAALQTSRAQA